MIDIDEYSQYKYNVETNEVYKNGSDTPIARTQRGSCNNYRRKMQRDDGKWDSISEKQLMVRCGLILKLPQDAIQVSGASSDYYIDKKSNVYSFSITNPHGVILSKNIGSRGYHHVSITINGKRTVKDVHSLMINTFVMKDYAKKGLCCLHRDNNKLNCELSNLSIGTYSKNTKDAYVDGLNPSKKGSVIHGILSSKRINWNNFDLIELVKNNNGNNTAIGKIVGCSANTIKRQRNILGV